VCVVGAEVPEEPEQDSDDVWEVTVFITVMGLVVLLSICIIYRCALMYFPADDLSKAEFSVARNVHSCPGMYLYSIQFSRGGVQLKVA
jgi:hypothetical protein